MLVKSAIKLMRRMFCTTEVIETDRTKISKFEIKNFNDNVRLTIKAGKGGNGAIAFYTDKRVRRGAPDGGDGGTGGNI